MIGCRAEGIGSLLRPSYPADARRQLERGDLTPAEFKRVEDRAVDEAVAVQEAAGLDVLTDGEQRRLRVLRASNRRARRVRQARGLGDPVPRRTGARGDARAPRIDINVPALPQFGFGTARDVFNPFQAQIGVKLKF